MPDKPNTLLGDTSDVQDTGALTNQVNEPTPQDEQQPQVQSDTDKIEQIEGEQFVTDYYDAEVTPLKEYKPQQLIQPQVSYIEYSLRNDNSLPVLQYLYSLGYTEGIWYINETHTERDVCDELYGITYNIASLVANANRNAPLFTLSHPGCKCYLLCIPPSSYDQIPDNAPGLPIQSSEEERINMKHILFNNLKQIPVYADSRLAFGLDYYAASLSRTKLGVTEATKKVTYIQPLLLNTNLLYSYILYLQNMFIKKEDLTCVSTFITNDKQYVDVFFPSRNYTFTLPFKYFKVAELVTDAKGSYKPNKFVILDDEIGVITRLVADSIEVYLPSQDIIVSTNESLCTLMNIVN